MIQFHRHHEREKRMSKARAKVKAVAVGDFTDQHRQAAGFTEERTHTMQGERRATLHTIRRRSPALGWGWLTQSQQAALIRYADLASDVEVSVKGCLAPPSGGDAIVGAERRMKRRTDYERARKACVAPALAFTDHALLGDAPPTLEAIALSSFGSPRDAALMTARALIGITASDLVRHFGP